MGKKFVYRGLSHFICSLYLNYAVIRPYLGSLGWEWLGVFKLCVNVKHVMKCSIVPYVRMHMVVVHICTYSAAKAASTAPKNESLSTSYMPCRPNSPAF